MRSRLWPSSRRAAGVLVALAAIAACGGGGEGDAASAPHAARGVVPSPRRRASAPDLYPGTEVIVPDTSSASLAHGGPTALDGMDLEQLADFRRAKVAEHASLGIFPVGYDPLRGPARHIYSRITAGANWLGPTPYYIANPYLLIVLTCANHATPLALFCPPTEVVYTPARIEETTSGDSGRCWLARVFDPDYADHAGSVRVVMVNAFDAGFPFTHLDLAASENLTATDAPTNVARGVFSQPSFYHLGRYGVNNISPEDRNGWVRLIDPSAATRFAIKLWRERPTSLAAAADFTYVVAVTPSE